MVGMIGRLLAAILMCATAGCADFVTLHGEITPQSAEAVIAQLRESRQDTIVIDLESAGGNVAAGSKIIEAISAAREHAVVVTRVKNFCNSMCVSVFLAGTQRVADNNASFSMHGAFNQETMEQGPDTSARLVSYYLARGLDPAWVLTKVHSGELMTSRVTSLRGTEMTALLHDPATDNKIVAADTLSASIPQ